MSSNEQYPARVERYNGVSVTLYEIDGKEFITGEDIGKCLGLSEPRIAINKIYNRNREELGPHRGVTKMVTPSGTQEIAVFTETGANLIGMFSRTPKAKAFRLWLARLPRKVREVREAAPAAAQRFLAEGVRRGFAVASDLLAGKIDSETLVRLHWLRRNGLTQKEAGRLLNLRRDQVQYLEKRLKELGFSFAPVNDVQRYKKMKDDFAEGLATGQISPALTAALPAPEATP